MTKRNATRPWSWRLDTPHWTALFVGRGSSGEREQVLANAASDPPSQLAATRQIHSAAVLEAAPGWVGAADALLTRQLDLAVSVASADCVPILLLTPEAVVAVHAGWRGLVQEIIAAAVARISPEPASVTALIGPAIGPCCYEVGPDVGFQLVAAADATVLGPGAGERPHANLQRLAALQLAACGVSAIHRVELCTRCNPAVLWSYRRDGPRAGRNLSFAWRQRPDRFRPAHVRG